VARVLIVEDDEEERLLQQSILEAAGHETYFARDGEVAVRTYGRQGIEVVLTDLMMPNVDGFELISVLGDFLPPPRIVAISGKGKEHLDRARLMGVVVTLEKPVDPTELLEAVDVALAASG